MLPPADASPPSRPCFIPPDACARREGARLVCRLVGAPAASARGSAHSSSNGGAAAEPRAPPPAASCARHAASARRLCACARRRAAECARCNRSAQRSSAVCSSAAQSALAQYPSTAGRIEHSSAPSMQTAGTARCAARVAATTCSGGASEGGWKCADDFGLLTTLDVADDQCAWLGVGLGSGSGFTLANLNPS